MITKVKQSLQFTLSPFLWVSIALCSVDSQMQASVSNEVLERTLKTLGHSLDDAGKVALKSSLKKASAEYGDDVLLAAERGGLDLVQAAGRHGDDVWRLAELSSDAPKALAAHAGELVRLSRRFGDDAVRLEIKAPGCGRVLAGKLPKKSMREVAEKAGAKEIQHFAAIAAHRSPKELIAAVNVWDVSKSGRFLEFLTPARIAASGFAGAMVAAAWNAPEAAVGVAHTLLTGLLGPVITVCSWIFVVAMLVLLRKPLSWLFFKLVPIFRGIWNAVRPSDGTAEVREVRNDE